MTKIKLLLIPAICLVFIWGCREDNLGKYERPEWLAGKVYSQILEQPDLSTFAELVQKTGYDTIIDVSGSYTVFAPTNEAFTQFFSSNPNYNSVNDIPADELDRLIKYHIVQNPWSKLQLQSLDIYGWIDTLDINNDEAKGYKRETLLFDQNRRYGVKQVRFGSRAPKNIIVDTLESTWRRRVITDSRKFAPVFYSQYFNIYDLVSSDYEFYFNRSFSPSDLYYANGKIVSDEIFAENGFVYKIDQVVEPLKNAQQILASGDNNYSFTAFQDLINLFPVFRYNERETFDQPGADEGLLVDSLFDLTYPELTFDIHAERTSPPRGATGLPQNVTIRYHHGLMAPTNEALDQFINDYIKIPNGWGTLNGAPEHIKRIIVNTNMSINPIYPTDYKQGFYNGEFDIVRLNENEIVTKKYGSNATFIGLSKAIVPRAFKSVTGPIYLQQGYAKVMYAIEKSGLLPALKKENKNYMLFVESDANTSLDSSLFYNATKESFSTFQLSEGSAEFQEFAINVDDLRRLLLNHVAVDVPKGIARKEFIPNLAGNNIVFNNVTGEVSGTDKTTKGFRGTKVEPEFPTILSNTADNGATYQIQNWFSFSAPSIYSKISTSYPRFHNLLRKAGLSNDKEFRYNFLSESEFYTIFIPNDSVLNASGADALAVPELRNLLQLHFVQGEIILTDGNKPGGYYETTRIDEKSTEFTTIYTGIRIETDYDFIRLPAKSGGYYLEIEESESVNQLTGINKGEGQELFPPIVNNGVIHEIDKILIKEELDIN